MIIAIDGPAGSGKSSTAKAVARELGYRHLDSGAFYRAITLAALERGIAVDQWPDLDASILDEMQVRAEPAGQGFAFRVAGRDVTQAIRSREVNAHVSRMAAVPAVRDWLLDQLRAVAEAGSVVADGRDIGTVVFPQADLKIFLIAQSEVRARRRLAEQGNTDPTDEEIQNEVDRLGGRDRADAARETAPLRQADDAVVIDTSGITFEQQVDRIVGLAAERDTGGGRDELTEGG